jgi:serine/threonine-protein kinase
MGTVLAAHHELLDVRVAVKLLSPQLVQNRSVVARFLREARAAARLKSEHVARVSDVGTLDDGQPYIVMELLEGEDLERRLQRLGRLAIRDAVDCMLQVLEAMAHAHAEGIVHRDLKPANLFVTCAPDGREVIKVLDFGIAKLTDASTPGVGSRSGVLTEEHSAIGSPSYMAPEQVRASREIDRRADIWALGTILYELVTGQVAFGGRSLGEIYAAVLHEKPTQLRVLRPDAPATLETVIARCLERDPNNRFPNVAQLALALAPLGSGAWAGHVARILQTVARAAKTGGPEAIHSRQFSAGAETIDAGALDQVGVELEELEVEFDESDVSRMHRRPRIGVAVVVALLGTTLLATVALLWAFGHATTETTSVPSSALPSTESAAVAPPPLQTSTVPAPPPRPAPSPVSSNPTPTFAGGHGGYPPPPRRPVPAPPKSGASRPSRLPGVLDSPE